MNRQEIIDLTTRIFVDEFEVDGSVIAPEANFRESLGLDSLDYVDLVVMIEQEFGVKLVEADFKPIVTFNDFYTTLESECTLTTKARPNGKENPKVLYSVIVSLYG